MNIKDAKEEIRRTLRAYTAPRGLSDSQSPPQRPILLIGPPGIGKTAIVEQVAEECQAGFVSYTMTHHTRQSAIGLPFLKEKDYEGKSFFHHGIHDERDHRLNLSVYGGQRTQNRHSFYR